MQYWLRRNNIDKGPFTREALLGQGLNTSDLIKIDGDSEWKSPTDFAELLPALKANPKPKYKFTADKKLVEIKDPPPVQPEATTPKPEPPAGPSPFKRMPSALPKKKATVAPPADPTADQANEKAKEGSRHNHSRPANSPEPTLGPAGAGATHAAANARQKIHPQIQSLDEAPLREVRHHPTPKPVRTAPRPQNSHFFKEFFLPIIIIGGIGFLAWWGYKQFTAPGAVSGTIAASSAGTDSSRAAAGRQDAQHRTVSSGMEGPAAIPMHPSTGNTSNQNSTNKAKQVSDSAQTVRTPVKSTPPPAKTPSTAATTAKPETETKKAAVPKDSSTDKNTAKASTNKTSAPVEKKPEPPTPAASTAKKEPEKKEPVKKAQKATSIADYVSLSLNKAPEPGIKNVKIKVRNTSKEDLNIAVIEVKYYDKDGKFIQGETLQTGKINAGKTTTLKIPSSRNADRISYKVSLISGDNVYLMGR